MFSIAILGKSLIFEYSAILDLYACKSNKTLLKLYSVGRAFLFQCRVPGSLSSSRRYTFLSNPPLYHRAPTRVENNTLQEICTNVSFDLFRVVIKGPTT